MKKLLNCIFQIFPPNTSNKTIKSLFQNNNSYQAFRAELILTLKFLNQAINTPTKKPSY